MLTLSPRKMLIARAQAYAYTNVKQGLIPLAETHLATVLRRFDDMMQDKPTDSAGYWAGFYFNEFVGACEHLG